MSVETASCAMELPSGAAPEWVHLLPKGNFAGRDGRAWKLSNPKGVVAAFAANAMDLPIDYEHQTDNAEKNGQPAPAAGWIKALDVRSDGLWGRVEWTAKAREMLAEREYRFLSPVFLFNYKTGEVMSLQGAGLTNRPNLLLTALARQETPNMDDALKAQLMEILGLSADAGDDAIVNQVKADCTPDPTKYVPVEQVKALMDELAALKATMTTEQAENTVEMAMRDGKLPPALREWGLALCRDNPQAFANFISTAGAPYANLGKELLGGEPPSKRKSLLGDDERAVCRNLGISEDEYLAGAVRS